MNKNNIRNFIYFIAIILIGLLAYSLFSNQSIKPKQVSISEIAADVTNNQISKITVSDNKVTADVKNDGQIQAYKEAGVGLKDYGITPDKVTIDVINTQNSSAWISLLGTIIPFLLIAGFIYLIFRQA
jgi:ATP-dependent Zn protease